MNPTKATNAVHAEAPILVHARVDGAVLSLNFGESILHAKRLEEDAIHAIDHAVAKGCRVGAFLLAAKAAFPHGVYGTWMSRVGIQRNTASRRVRLYLKYGDERGGLDEVKLREAVRVWNDGQEKSPGSIIDLGRITLRRAEMVAGIRKEAEKSPTLDTNAGGEDEELDESELEAEYFEDSIGHERGDEGGGGDEGEESGEIAWDDGVDAGAHAVHGDAPAPAPLLGLAREARPAGGAVAGRGAGPQDPRGRGGAVPAIGRQMSLGEVYNAVENAREALAEFEGLDLESVEHGLAVEIGGKANELRELCGRAIKSGKVVARA